MITPPAPPFLLREPIGALWLGAKVTLLLAAIGVVARSRRWSDVARHRLWAFALLGVLALVLLTPLVPRVRFEIGGSDGTPGVVIRTHPVPPEFLARRLPGAPLAPATSAPLRWLSSLWLAGVLVLLVRMGGVQLLLLRLFRTAREASPELCALGEQGSMRARVLISDRITAPATWGSLRPVILLPVAAERWPASLVRSVLAHESAHVRRRDHLVQSLGGFACAVFWFHPLAWMALRRLRMAGERAADERTISSGIPPRVYAAHLVDVARASWGQAGLSGGLGMVRRSELEHRIVAILDPSQPRPAAEPRVLTGLVVAFAALVVALAAIRIHIG